VAFGDYDNDGDLDLFLANRVSPLKLFENDGRGNFTDVSSERGFNQSLLAYGANWGDLDQDGYLDLFVTTLGKNYIFWNRGGQFFEIDSTALPRNDLSYSMGSLLEDIDLDGDLDIVVANLNISYSRIYLNMLERTNYIKVRLRGRQSNYDGIGGRVWLYDSGHAGERKYLKGFRQISTNTGYRSSRLPEAYFGVSPGKTYDLVVDFPSGKRIQIPNLVAGNTYIVQEEASLSSRFGNLLSRAKVFLYRQRPRHTLLRVAFFLLLLLLFNAYIYFRTYWPLLHLLFFNTFLLSAYILAVTLYDRSKMDFRWFIPIYATLVAGVIAFVIVQRYTAVRHKTQRQYELYDLIRQLHHSKDGIKQIHRLLFYLNNIGEAMRDPRMKEDLQKQLDSLCTITIPMVQRVLDEAKRLGISRPQAHQMEIAIKNLCHAIPETPTTSVNAIQALDHLGPMLRKLLDEVLALQRSVERLFVCDLFQVLNHCLGEFPEFTEVSVSNRTQRRSLQVIIPYEELAQVFTNLFQNALEAMRSMKDKRIHISIHPPAGDNLTIDVQDFGEGVCPQLHSLIFEESFSTKGSSGLGLFHARKLLRRYGGDLVLILSAPNEGSVFQITTRVAEP